VRRRPDQPALFPARLIFLLYGLILGAWTTRIPAVKAHLRLSDSKLSIGLLAFAAGAIVGMQASGWLVDRLGAATVIVPAVLVDAAALVGPAYAGSLLLLVLALLAFGVAHGVLNVAMNVNAVQVQSALGRPIISSCHAVYSIGGFLGAAVGGLFAYEGRGAAATFVSVAVLVVAAALAVARPVAGFVPPAQTQAEAAAPLTGVVFLGVLAFCCLVGEGAAADWSAVYLRDDLGTTAAWAAAAYACFAIMMTAGRLAGDRLAARFGPAALARAGGVLAAAGLSLSLLVAHPVAGVIGFGCLGAGLSCIAPQVFAAAGLRNPGRAGTAIGRVASLGFLGFVVGPVVIGAASRWVGLTWALLIPAVLAGFVAIAAPALRAPASPVLLYPETTPRK
jgi:predicted MFS family arabinose efflux permease